MTRSADGLTTVAEIEECLYWYRATVIPHPKRGGESVYDADTLYLELDPGFNRAWREDTRVARIDAPELRGKERQEGLRARDWLREALPVGAVIYVRTWKDKGKFGRYVAELYLPREDGTVICLNDVLVAEGLAEYKEY